ncbi:MAG TPA: VPLPA-CTERM sorting domain-containing protein [Steroidobacteraceae bacterium]|jgi:hypothetical protein
MKLSIKPLAAAVSFALISVSAHAALVSPVQGTAVPGTNGLYLETWNTVSGATELVNLSYAYTDIASANVGNLNTASGPAWTTASNPAGSGTVSQLNFGTIANTSAGFTNYAVVSAATATQTGIPHIQGASVTSGSSPSAITNTGLVGVVNAVETEIANWASLTNTGTFFDATGATTANAATGPANGGTFNNGLISSGAVNSALSFYNILGNTYVAPADGIPAHGSTTTAYAGFWFLSSTGQLSYNIASAAAPIPLPAAVWLLGSGLLGLIGVGRRRSAAV